jgi:hypothetical protein
MSRRYRLLEGLNLLFSPFLKNIKVRPMLKYNFAKKSIIVLLLIILFNSGKANFFDKDPWFTSKDLMIKNKTFFELFGGVVSPDMTYSIKSFNKIEQVPLFLYDVGISLRFQRGKWFSFSPRLTYLCQGVSINNDLKYRLRANYVNFSIPLELQFELNKKMNKSVTRFFFYATPYIATPISVNLKTNIYSDWLSYSEMNVLNVGGEAGLGFRIPTYSLEGSSNITIRLSYLRGLNDTYTKLEKNIVNQTLRDQLYLDGGKRYNSAVLLTIGIEIPVKAKKYVSFTAGGDGKKNYKRVVVVDEK